MQGNYCFYVHHHGSGHLMRALAIANVFNSAKVTFIGSNLSRFIDIIPSWIRLVHLPLDTPENVEDTADYGKLSFLHYAPLHVRGLRERNAMITAFFAENPNVLCIVDVSVEVTLLARLCGVPTVVIRQHGERNDLAHRLAYESAQLLIAPYPSSMADDQGHAIFTHKTFFSGGFSRYSGTSLPDKQTDHHAIAVFIGRGGTALDFTFLSFLRRSLPLDYRIHVLGIIDISCQIENCFIHGDLPNPADIIRGCDIVIGNAGHNIVMEMADLRKRFVCIPAERPFREQQVKALQLKKLGVIVVPEADIYSTNWQLIMERAAEIDTKVWDGVITPNALGVIADELHSLYQDLFAQKSFQQLNYT